MLGQLIDQYHTRTDNRSGITNDPSRRDDPQHILRFIAQVIPVSLETVKIIKGLPPLDGLFVLTESNLLFFGFRLLHLHLDDQPARPAFP